MSYSARQVHCLEKMGIVPWVDVRSNAQHSAQPLSVQTRSAGVSGTANRPVAFSAPDVANPAGARDTEMVPDEPAELALWVSSQPLVSFVHRGVQQSVLGSASAPLLVIVQTDETLSGPLPLCDESTKLFDLMLQSINLSRTDVRLCVVSGASDNPERGTIANQTTALSGHTELSGQAGAGGACLPGTRAVLLLQHSWAFTDSQKTAAEQHAMRLATHVNNQSLPMWRMPHPQQLLQHSSLKRVAWQVLKAIRVSLNSL